MCNKEVKDKIKCVLTKLWLNMRVYHNYTKYKKIFPILYK